MEKRVKKNALIGVIIGSLVLAAGITYMTRSPKGGIPKHFAQEMTWVKCRNPKCGAEYQISKKEYFEYVEEHHDPRIPHAPSLICQQCGQQSVYRAVKCERCGLVFEMGSVPGDYQDRCPKCSYSKLENEKKKATGSGGG